MLLLLLLVALLLRRSGLRRCWPFSQAHFEKTGVRTATQMRNLPIQTSSDMRKLFKEMGLDYDRHTKEAAQVKNAIEKVKRAEAKAQKRVPETGARNAAIKKAKRDERTALKPTGLKLESSNRV